MGHRISTLCDGESVGTGASTCPSNQTTLSRATVLFMIVTVATATSSSSPSSPPSCRGAFASNCNHNIRTGGYSTATATSSSSSCCFVAATAASATNNPIRHRDGNKFKFRRRSGTLLSATSAASTSSFSSSSLSPQALLLESDSNDTFSYSDTTDATSTSRTSGNPLHTESSTSTSLGSIRLRAHSLNFRRDSSKIKGGIPISSYRLGLRPYRSKPTTRRTGGGADGSNGISRGKRPIGDFPPHLAAALGPSAFSDDGELVLDDEEYERRKMEWAKRYTDVSTLRETFGNNRNQLWGDLDPETTRRLYHTLLPRALMGLYDMGLMRPHELAPLAYEARNAAKKYARERCVVPGRVFSMAYDGFRSLRDYGKWNHEGMSWEQVWEKYEQQIIDEFDFEDHEDDELTKQICLRILERSCRTNTAVDRMFLKDSITDSDDVKNKDAAAKQERLEMAEISAKLERDVHELLFEGAQKSRFFNPTREQRKKLKARRREHRKGKIVSKKKIRTTEKNLLKVLKKEEKLKRKARRFSRKNGDDATSTAVERERSEKDTKVKLNASEVWLLRKLVGTKRRIRAFRAQTPLVKKIHQDEDDDDDEDKGYIINSSISSKHNFKKSGSRENHRKEYRKKLIIVEKRPWLSRGRILPKRNKNDAFIS